MNDQMNSQVPSELESPLEYCISKQDGGICPPTLLPRKVTEPVPSLVAGIGVNPFRISIAVDLTTGPVRLLTVIN